MEGQPHKLLESVAERLASEIMNDYHQVQGLQVHIKKPHVAVTGVVESLGKAEPETSMLSFARSEGVLTSDPVCRDRDHTIQDTELTQPKANVLARQLFWSQWGATS